MLQESHEVAINMLPLYQTTGIGDKYLTLETMTLLRARAQLLMCACAVHQILGAKRSYCSGSFAKWRGVGKLRHVLGETTSGTTFGEYCIWII